MSTIESLSPMGITACNYFTLATVNILIEKTSEFILKIVSYNIFCSIILVIENQKTY